MLRKWGLYIDLFSQRAMRLLSFLPFLALVVGLWVDDDVAELLFQPGELVVQFFRLDLSLLFLFEIGVKELAA